MIYKKEWNGFSDDVKILIMVSYLSCAMKDELGIPKPERITNDEDIVNRVSRHFGIAIPESNLFDEDVIYSIYGRPVNAILWGYYMRVIR